ncbi:uncharacterized protein LOC106877883 isoform X2 [Octopus bimaculoides]|uniref:uncharacterized protein LOC106877883 isoform X2 n=1 Tax=Octopus bimaculoides TaxID=37653 RepID=UPI0022E77273|nr:uncharacterized protein LOC106877883 isoform X2 [Octopus bimaculoides]
MKNMLIIAVLTALITFVVGFSFTCHKPVDCSRCLMIESCQKSQCNCCEFCSKVIYHSYWKFEEYFPFKITTYFPFVVTNKYDRCQPSVNVLHVNNPVYLNPDSSGTSEPL